MASELARVQGFAPKMFAYFNKIRYVIDALVFKECYTENVISYS